jgi:hypothetical protein
MTLLEITRAACMALTSAFGKGWGWPIALIVYRWLKKVSTFSFVM